MDKHSNKTDNKTAVSCDSCGACCMEQCSPPGFLNIISGIGAYDDHDQELFDTLPPIPAEETPVSHPLFRQ